MTVTRGEPRFRRPRAPERTEERPPAGAERNPGMPLDLDLVRAIRVNRSAVERRAATLPTRRTVKKDWQAAWLLRAITCIDLTTLRATTRPGNVRRLCAKARAPVRRRSAGGAGRRAPRHHGRRGVRLSRPRADRGRGARGLRYSGRRRLDRLSGRAESLSAAVGGDPGVGRGRGGGDRHRHHARARADRRLGRAVRRGARVPRRLRSRRTSRRSWPRASWRRSRNVARASLVAMMAGADFIKTSTGKEPVNATLAGRPRDDAHDPRIPRTHRRRGRVQAGRRHPHGQDGARLADPHEGRARRRWLPPISSASARARC